MWIDEDGRATGIYDSRQLITDIDAAHGQSGGPLALDWGGGSPRVVASLVWGPNPVEDPNYFMPGWENTKQDTWFEWLCNEFGRRHPDDRFGGLSTLKLAQDVEFSFTDGQLPDYGQNSHDRRRRWAANPALQPEEHGACFQRTVDGRGACEVEQSVNHMVGGQGSALHTLATCRRACQT